MKKQGKRSILLCFSIMLLTVDISMSVHSSWNWFEAQQHCSNTNDTLKTNVSSTTAQHWTGFYRRLSPWIKYLGCYDAKYVEEHRTYNFHMNFTSAGFCREICESVNSTLFGIKLKECVCLKFTILAETILSNKCTNKCNDVEDGDIKFLECGGPYAYSLFKSVLLEDDDVGRGTACLAIDCGPVKKFTISVDCSESYFGICAYEGYLGCFKDQKNRILTGDSYSKECFCGNFLSISIRKPERECDKECKGDKSQTCGGDWRISIYNNPNHRTIRETNWTESMKSCKIWYPPFDLIRNATFACERLHMTKNGLFWLSIVKEIYTGYDRGVAVDADDKASFLQCQKCNKTGCEFIDCLQRMNYSICEEASAIEIIHRRAGSRRQIKRTRRQHPMFQISMKIIT